MELWFSDYHTDKVKMSVKVEKQLFGEQTDFQRIDVFDSKEFGRFISSDGSIVFSEKDEFVYDEMIFATMSSDELKNISHDQRIPFCGCHSDNY